ncbi:hypothetical protein MTR_1g100990 [Medicago truncatula]|uniref:Uncharacterized protein n=1 Tax=Medicago truncatula TaxID=3880 RepID=G7IAM0_MEDTR|nr:hypothetical protein MTR_1g100990 [Medicago truncatula]
MREEERDDERFKYLESLTAGDTWPDAVCQVGRMWDTRRQGASLAGGLARSSFQGRTLGIPGSILRRNNAWPVRMPLRISRISRSPLVGRKPGGVCFKVKNDIPGNTWLGNDYIHVCYEVEKKIFLGIKVPGNGVTSHNFHYFHEYIPM